jgi:hypothetical protein
MRLPKGSYLKVSELLTKGHPTDHKAFGKGPQRTADRKMIIRAAIPTYRAKRLLERASPTTAGTITPSNADETVIPIPLAVASRNERCIAMAVLADAPVMNN